MESMLPFPSRQVVLSLLLIIIIFLFQAKLVKVFGTKTCLLFNLFNKHLMGAFCMPRPGQVAKDSKIK